ncbi:MAG: hypothetical protein AVDCRST_MAG40-2799 [uncultured Gemmatimonadaceae bacterium]|uniref:Uncharacterized protein n=1 Tax=uncultured Gemmatimonadaceae bacterium TaxID=246130 RepID=A0A6J4M3X3_9BACT|nr:MAG: hypothetical protein AVDCRST_MAG40-2799 [uncultured Gemmatimonadaceae bacterium]
MVPDRPSDAPTRRHHTLNGRARVRVIRAIVVHHPAIAHPSARSSPT